MVFSSIPFLFFFLPLFLILYYLVPFKYKNYILLIFSLIFYAWGEPIYIVLMIISTLVDFINSKYFSKKKNKKLYFIISILINLGLLTFFKYSDFLITILNDLFNISIPLLNLKLPIGISFYTFQTMSYSIDVYNKKVKPENNYFNYLTYVSMFPQLIAGPIVRYETINNELKKRTIDIDSFNKGFTRFLKGLFKKVLLANNIGLLFTTVYNSDINTLSVLIIWLSVLAFTLQIYFDFSGYSDMAIGLGKMLGFSFLENFNYPYISKSITEFWRRWHISLSSWFKDYIYIPLKGNRCGLLKHIRNIMIVWLLTGLWHGASYNFILWGLYYGVLLILEKYVFKIDKLPNILKHIYALFFIVLGWAIFAFDNNLLLYLKSMFGFNNLNFINSDFILYIRNYIGIIILGIVFSIPIKIKLNKYLEIIIYVLLFIITLSYLVSSNYNPFLYFRF